MIFQRPCNSRCSPVRCLRQSSRGATSQMRMPRAYTRSQIVTVPAVAVHGDQQGSTILPETRAAKAAMLCLARGVVHPEIVHRRTTRGRCRWGDDRQPMAADQAMAFADLLRRRRVAAGLTQETLAERAGLSARAISDLERGLHRHPHRDTVQLIAEALQLPQQERGELLDAAARRPTPAGLREAPPAVRAAIQAGPAGPAGLPAPPTPILGRDTDLQAVIALLRR